MTEVVSSGMLPHPPPPPLPAFLDLTNDDDEEDAMVMASSASSSLQNTQIVEIDSGSDESSSDESSTPMSSSDDSSTSDSDEGEDSSSSSSDEEEERKPVRKPYDGTVITIESDDESTEQKTGSQPQQTSSSDSTTATTSTTTSTATATPKGPSPGYTLVFSIDDDDDDVEIVSETKHHTPTMGSIATPPNFSFSPLPSRPTATTTTTPSTQSATATTSTTTSTTTTTTTSTSSTQSSASHSFNPNALKRFRNEIVNFIDLCDSDDEGEADEKAKKQKTEEIPTVHLVKEDEDVCPICLGDCEDPTIPDGCKHIFCFMCIVQWSSINPKCLCPLCKKQFHSLLHDIKSPTEFKRFYVEVEKSPPPVRFPHNSGQPIQVRRLVLFGQNNYQQPHQQSRYHDIRAQSRRRQFEARNYRRRPDWGAPSYSTRSSSTYSSPSASSSSSTRRHFVELTAAQQERKKIYTRNLRPITTQFPRETSQFASPDYIKRSWWRIEPWLKRELQMLTEDDDDLLITYVQSLLERRSLERSRDYQDIEESLRSFLFGNTSKFLRELKIYICSGLSMPAYDDAIRYE